MSIRQNPDVNSIESDDDYPVQPETNPDNIEGEPDPDVQRKPVPLPPDVENPYPVTDPPIEDDVPLGDVDDSPMRIASS